MSARSRRAIGRPAVQYPAWLQGKALYEWVEIAGTSGAGGATVDAWGGIVITSAGKVIIAAAGGHNDSSDNRVVDLDLTADAPTWATRIAASGSVQIDVAHYADGKPTSRHNYHNGCYVPSLDKVFLVGVAGAWGNGDTFAAVDAYNATAFTWDAASTYTDCPGGNSNPEVGAAFDGTYIWASRSNRFCRLHTGTGIWDTPITSRIASPPGWPFTLDSNRRQLFGLQIAAGAARCSRVPVDSPSAEIAVTLSGAGLATLLAEDMAGNDAEAVEYDPNNDRCLFYCGQGAGSAGRIYAVTMTGSDTAGVTILTLTGTGPGLSPSGSGIAGRIRYVAALKGFVTLPRQSSNLFFFKVA